MGHRTYLLIQAGGQVRQLFEANNMLPVFWLALLEQSDLQAVEPQWQLLERLNQEGLEEELERFTNQWPSPTNVVLSRGAVATNSARFALVLQRHRPELAALHQEFLRYLLARLPQETDLVQLDLVALTGFSSTTECLQSLRDELAALGDGQLLALPTEGEQVMLTGFANELISSAEYPALSHLQAVNSQPQPSRAQGGKERAVIRWNIFSQLFVVAAGVLLLGASYPLFRKEGFTGTVLGVLLLGAVVLASGVAGLLAHRPRKL